MTVEQINQLIKGTMDEWIGLEYIEIGDDFVKAKMQVDHRTKQPYGIMHGGASAAMAESVGSMAGNMAVHQAEHHCVGQSIHTSHVRKATDGTLIGTARPVHLGRTSQIWEIKIEDKDGRLISVTRLTLAVLDRTNKSK